MVLSITTRSFEMKYAASDTQTTALLENHCHTRFEMIAVLSGCIDILIEGHAHRCKKGEIALIPPLTYHSVTLSDTSEYKRITALFDGSSLPPIISKKLTENIQAKPIFSLEALPYMTASLHKAIEKRDTETYSPLAESIALQIIYTCAEEKRPEHSPAETPSDDVLENAIKYVDRHITEKLSLEDVAQALFISRSSLCHIFSERMQISPKQYIIQKKMAYATMLIENGMPMTQAARAVGYENYSNFYRIRKRFATK